MFLIFSTMVVYAQGNKGRGYILDAENSYNPQIDNANHNDYIIRMKEVQATYSKTDIFLKKANDFLHLKKYD